MEESRIITPENIKFQKIMEKIKKLLHENNMRMFTVFNFDGIKLNVDIRIAEKVDSNNIIKPVPE